MLVRTYGRRPSHHRSAASASSSGGFAFPLSPGSSQEDELPNDSQEPFFLSQDPLLVLTQESSAWGHEDDADFGEPRKDLVSTATLMEAQEYGEMMEQVDEVVFALDGLRSSQPPRVMRASMLSLLSASATPRQRRLLRAQGLATRIIDAILLLDVDDTPCIVAAAALFFVLASDIQDDHLLDSPACISFLLKLLNPGTSSGRSKVSSIGSKLLGICKAQSSNSFYKDADSSSEEIFSKVEEILVSCKEVRPSIKDEEKDRRPELSSKWIALLTMEKACLSAVSFEDTTEVVRRVGGNFKEKLRELGGLDAIFEVLVSCHSVLESTSLVKTELEKGAALQSVALLLKCLKIMENATFLSKDNQDHLLSLSKQLKNQGPAISFVRVVLSIIELLSAFSLSGSSLGGLNDSESQSSEIHHVVTLLESKGATMQNTEVLPCNLKKLPERQKRKKFSPPTSEVSFVDLITDSSEPICSLRMKMDCSPSTSCNGPVNNPLGEEHTKKRGLKFTAKKDGLKFDSVRHSNGWISLKSNLVGGTSKGHAKKARASENVCTGSQEDLDPFAFDEGQMESNLVGGTLKGNAKKAPLSENVCTGSQEDLDPFAFDEGEMEPSKWDLLSSKMGASQDDQAASTKMGSLGDYDLPVPVVNIVSSQSNCNSNNESAEKSSHSLTQNSSLLEDCLLTSVKALMNLTNDNPVGCLQIGACGGLDTMASLLIKHFPSFDFSDQVDKSMKGKLSSAQAKHLRDHELDFLVAILGLLVNLVEKDSENRERLASARVFVGLPGCRKNNRSPRDLIPLLCSIFLTNQGAGEGVGVISLDDEDSLLEGQREAENMIVQAYAALLLAFLSTESRKVREAIAACLPENSLKVLVPVLERFVAFHLTLNMISPETHGVVTKVIEACKGS